MLKAIKSTVALMTVLTMAACGSVTGVDPDAPIVVNPDDASNRGDQEFNDTVEAGDEFTPDHDGGGGAQPGQSQDSQRSSGGHAEMREDTEGANVNGQGIGDDSLGGLDNNGSSGSSGEGGEWTPER